MTSWSCDELTGSRTIAQLCRAMTSQIRHRPMSTIGKNLLNSNISSTCPHMTNFGPLTAEIGSGVWGTQADFNGFRVLASLLQRRRLPEANQTLPRCLAVSWVGTLYMHFCPVQNSFYVQVLRSPTLAALLYGITAAGDSQTLRRGTRNGITEISQRAPPIYAAGRPSRWTSARILVLQIFHLDIEKLLK